MAAPSSITLTSEDNVGAGGTGKHCQWPKAYGFFTTTTSTGHRRIYSPRYQPAELKRQSWILATKPEATGCWDTEKIFGAWLNQDVV
jgi:hypothetical protein